MSASCEERSQKKRQRVQTWEEGHCLLHNHPTFQHSCQHWGSLETFPVNCRNGFKALKPSCRSQWSQCVRIAKVVKGRWWFVGSVVRLTTAPENVRRKTGNSTRSLVQQERSEESSLFLLLSLILPVIKSIVHVDKWEEIDYFVICEKNYYMCTLFSAIFFNGNQFSQSLATWHMFTFL